MNNPHHQVTIERVSGMTELTNQVSVSRTWGNEKSLLVLLSALTKHQR